MELIFCVCDDLLITIKHQDDPQSQMSTSEIMTTAIVAASYFSGNHEKSRKFLKDHGYVVSFWKLSFS